MNRIFKNNILTKGILGFLVVFIFLIAPISISLQTSTVLTSTTPSTQLVFEMNTAAAAISLFSLSDIGNGAVNMVGYAFLTLAAALTWIGGTVLDHTLEFTVFGMGERFMTGGLGAVVNTTWTLIRDISNLAFIFGFIFVGIRTIIDPEHADTKRFLSRIIIGALLINFSLFITKAIIDFSNFTAFKIYSAIVGSDSGSIASTVATILGLGKFYSIEFGQALAEDVSISFYFLAALFLIIAAFIFLVSAILLIIRFIALVFIMIFSPILFAATVFPKTEHFASDLWKNLINYSIFAPAYLLLTLVSITILKGLSLSGPGFNQLADPTAIKSDNVATIFNFIIAIGFLLASLLVANKIGIAGGSAAVSAGNTLRGKVQSAVGRNTVGLASKHALHAYEKHDAKMATDEHKNTWQGRLSRFGRGALGGDRAIRGAMHAGEHAKFGGSYSHEDDEKYDKERKARQGKINEATRVENAVTAGAAATPGTPAGDQSIIDMERAIATASTEQLQGLLKEFEDDADKYNAVIEKMTSSQFDNIMKLKSEDLDDAAKTNLRKARAAATERKLKITSATAAGANSPAIPASPGNIGDASTSDLEALDYQTLSAHAAHLTHKQIDEAKNLTATEKTNLKEKRKQDLGEILMPGGSLATATTARALLDRVGSDSEIAKLPNTYLANPEVIKKLKRNVLEIIMSDGKMKVPERKVIRDSIIANTPAGSELRKYLTGPKGSSF